MTTAIGTELGAAAGYALLDLGGTSTFDENKSGITGNVGLVGDTDWVQFGQSTIVGSVTYGAGVTGTSTGTTKVTGSITENTAAVNTAKTDALDAATFFKNLAANLPISDFGGASGTLPNGGVVDGTAGTYNVVDLTGLSSGGGTFTLHGAPGTEFVINVDGNINLSGGLQFVETGGITAADVIINETDPTATVLISGAGKGTLINAVILAPTNEITFDGNVTGAVIGGEDNTINVTSGISLTYAADLMCFMAGTTVATPSGGVAVETLAAGDLVLTSVGHPVPILWIGRQTVSTRFADPLRVLPIRVKAGALDDSLPVRDLLVSPTHALLVGDILIQAGALVNGTSIVRESNVPEIFVYYHVELEDHSLILAEGVPAETFLDGVSEESFDNWDERKRLYPEGRESAEMDYPRAKSRRQVPMAVGRRLAVRAVKLGEPIAEAA